MEDIGSDLSGYSAIPKELQFKVLVIGEFGVGKTAVVRRYTQGHYSDNYKVTIGVDFAVKVLQWNARTKVNLQLWDIAGHERFGTLTRVYYKYAVAAVVVFDLSRPESLETVLKWVKDIREKVILMDNQQHFPVILLANKCDVEGITINTSVISNFCINNNIDGWFLTSAKKDININTAMHHLLTKIFEQRNKPPTPIYSVRLTPEEYEVKKEESGCCR